MKSIRYRTARVLLLAVIIAYACQPGLATAKLIIEGTVVDSSRQTAVPQATIRVLGTALSTLANDDGHFRLILENGSHRIKVTHVAFYSDSTTLSGSDTTITVRLAISPAPTELAASTVRPRAYDPAQEIIRRAIERKSEILARLKDYTCEAYTRVNVHDNTKKDSALFLVAETRSTGYWERPNKYKEVITARRQSANMKAHENLVSIGQVTNFNRNRIEIGRYSIVSPTATDALDHYRYYLLDTVEIDNRRVFVLEMEPKSEVTPLFTGSLQIADSTYDVVAVDGGFNRAADFGMLKNPHYLQRHIPLAPDIWMPVEIRFTGDVVFGIALPGVPKSMSFEMLASLAEYKFDQGMPKGTLDEYVMEVAPTADKNDTTVWQAEHVIPLSREEETAYRRIDSVEHLPKPFLKTAAKIVPAAILLTTFGNDDFFRFNRVEGPYLGLAVRPRQNKFTAPVSFGYAFSAKRWEGSAGLIYQSDKGGMEAGIRGFDLVARRSSLMTSPAASSTFGALWYKFDGLDYFRGRGGSAWVGFRPINKTRASIAVNAATHSTLGVNSDFSIFRNNRTPRENPAIEDGNLRTVSTSLTFDSRKLVKTGRGEETEFAPKYLAAIVKADWSTPDFLKSDFHFGRYLAQVNFRVRPPIPGLTTVNFLAGTSTGNPPPQMWFIVDHGPAGMVSRPGFVTLHETNFTGSRAAVVTVDHRFGRRALAMTHIPFVEKLPFSITVHGAAFWTDDHAISRSTYTDLRVAKRAYTETGFTIGNLTPFLSPFNLQASFIWQLSDYKTDKFALNVDFGF